MSRTPLFDVLRRTVRAIGESRRPGAPPVDEVLGLSLEARLSRRELLRRGAGVAAIAGATSQLGGCAALSRLFGGQPDIVIVGAGLAGLTAAYKLHRQGIRVRLYDASSATGGRVMSRTGVLGEGLVTEFGGEFIDTAHEDMFALATELGLETVDLHQEDGGPEDALYHFGGRPYTEREFAEAFRPFAPRVAADHDSIVGDVNFEHDGGATRLDRLSVAEYLLSIGVDGWLGDLLRVSYATEFGLDAGDQSALNFITVAGGDLASGGDEDAEGHGDERHVIRGGNQLLTDALTSRVAASIRKEERLVAIHRSGRRYRLTFERRGGGTHDVGADIVLLALPFSTLRECELRLELPAVKRAAIMELGYGRNAKLMAGFDAPFWRALDMSGTTFSDERYMSSWDNARANRGGPGGITFFLGGEGGANIGQGSPGEALNRTLPGFARVVPDALQRHNGRLARQHWPSVPTARGSYSCYRPGQWTSIRGVEGLPVGRLLFAGEHASITSQGYMNGAVETGRLAAEAIVRLVEAH